MPLITRLIPHYTQPQSAGDLDRSNRLTDKLVAAFTCGGPQFADARHPHLATADNSVLRVADKGKLRDYAAGTYTQFKNIPAYGLTGAMTIVVIADVDALTDYGHLIANQETATINGWEVRLGAGIDDSRIVLHRSNSDWRQSVASATSLITAGSKNNFISVTSPNGSIETLPRFCVNGTFYAGADLGGAGTGLATINASAVPVRIGSRYDDVTRLDGAIQFIGLWDRALSDAELLALRANPWQLFQPRKQKIFTADAAVSGTIAVTLAASVPSIAGTTTILGTIAQTLSAFTPSMAGTTTILGTLAQTLVGATSSIAGTVTVPGTISTTLSSFTSAIAGTTTIVGTALMQGGNALSSIAGTTTILGTIGTTQANMIMTASGTAGDPTPVRQRTLVGMGE